MDLRTRLLLLAFSQLRGKPRPFLRWGELAARGEVDWVELVRTIETLDAEGLIRRYEPDREIDITPAGVAAVTECLGAFRGALSRYDEREMSHGTW